VRTLLTQALSVYQVDAEALRRLRPDFIITQTQCEVCAVSLKDVESALCNWVESRPRVISLEPNALSDVWTDIERVAKALGTTERGTKLVQDLQLRMNCVAEQAKSIASRPTVGCIEWIDPLMAAGNWMPELVGLAGGVNLFGEAGKHSPYMRWEDLVARDPDVIVVCPCGFDLKRTRHEMTGLTLRPGWQRLNAVRKGRVYLTDGNQYFNRPGPRLAESLEILAEILYPQIFNFGHNLEAWEAL
jgi:iron complex transport system substrate-binding protein